MSGARDALLALHFQNDICHPDGRIPFSLARNTQDASRFLDASRRALATARRAGWTIAHVHIAFAPDYSDLMRNCRLFLKTETLGALKRGSWGAAALAGFEPAERDVVVATNGYTGPVTPALRRRVISVTSYMIATAPLSPNLMATLMPKGRMLTDSNRLLCYFRPSPDNTRVLFGGRPAYTEIGAQLAAERLTRYMTRIFPELEGVELTHSWFGFIAYTFDRLPHVGECDGMHYAMGYCGSGVVMSTWLGRKAALRLLGEQEGDSAFAELGHPTSPFYSGKPWFLPFVQAWYQGADLLGR